MREYEKLGMQPPRWYVIDEVLIHAALLADFFKTEADLAIAGLEVFSAPLFEYILANLLENAKEHGNTVTRVKLSFRIAEDSGILLVEDNGIGVPCDQKKAIFTKGYGKKTKLGLYVSREILAMTGITIDETGEEGNGARFEISIPKGAYRFSPSSHG
jgi:signal transduction histidine kinase